MKNNSGSGMECAGVRGFTLLEIMIALAIVGGLLITLIYTLNYNLGLAERHEGTTISAMLAKDKMDEAELNPASTQGPFPEPYTGYRYTVGVKAAPYPGLSEITVRVDNGNTEFKVSEYIRNDKH